MSKAKTELFNRIKEFEENELKYSESLGLIGIFKKKIGSTYLDEKSSHLIFRNVGLITHLERNYALKINTLIQSIESIKGEEEEAERILAIFSRVHAAMKDHFEHLSHPLIRYMSSHEDATELLNGIKFRSTEFNKLLMSVSIESPELHGKSLESLLITPIQQSPRRSMQIKAITKSFRKVFPSSKTEVLDGMLTMIENFVSNCNNAIGSVRVKKICQHIEWGQHVMRHVACEEFKKQLRGESRLPCSYVDSGRLLRRSGFTRYEPTYIYLFNDMLVVLDGAEKTNSALDILFLQQCLFPKTNLSEISKKGKFRLNAPSLCNRNNICSMKFRGVTPGETMYWHDKIKKCLKRHSSLVVRGVSMEISNSLRHVASVETIGSVETDSEEEKEEEEDVEDDKEKDVDFLTFQFGAENLRNRDGHGIKAFGISDPYFEIVNRNLNEVIFKSEVIRDDLNPTWDEAKIPIKKIRGAMMTVKVWDLDPKKSDYLGEVHMTWTELCSLPQGSKLKLHDEETDHKYDKTSGNLILLKWELTSISK